MVPQGSMPVDVRHFFVTIGNDLSASALDRPFSNDDNDMRLSIRTVSRFVISAEILRARTSNAANQAVTFDYIVDAAQRADGKGEKVREALTALAARVDETLGSSAPHVLTTDRVMQTRAADIRVLKAVHGATMGLVAKGADRPATPELERSLLHAVRTIDESGFSTGDRRAIHERLRTNSIVWVDDAEQSGLALLSAAERTYGEQFLEEKLSPYLKTPLPHSDDNEPMM